MRFGPWLVLAALSFSASARADLSEFMRALVLHPSDPRLMVLRYESGYGGLLLSRDGGHSFTLLPALAISKYALRGHVPIQFASDGKLLIAMDNGLFVDDGNGCQFSSSGSALDGAWVVDLAADPNDPEVTFALTMASPTRDGHAGLWRRTASEISPLGASDPAPAPQRRHLVRPASLKVVARAASAGGLRFIEGALVSEDGDPAKKPKPVLRVSDDQGASWTTHEITADPGMDGLPRILIIEGADPFRALVALELGSNEDISEASGPEPVDPIFVTTDSAATFSLRNSELKMADQALRLPSGRILIADRCKGGGLWSAESLDAPLSKILDEPTHCLGYRAETDTLFACRSHELGVLELPGNSFCAFFQNREAEALTSCPNQPVTANEDAIEQLCNKWCGPLHFATSPACASTPVLATCVAEGIAYDIDAGVVEAPGASAAPRCPPPALPVADAGVHADADDDMEHAEDDDVGPGSSGCGCRLARAHSSRGPLAFASLLALAAVVYRRRRARQPRV